METGVHPPSARTMVKADFVTGLIFFALGVAVVVESLRMPRFEELDVNPYTAPGLVPGILGAIILMLGAVLFVRAAVVFSLFWALSKWRLSGSRWWSLCYWS